jgi:hypothetical protein
MASGWKTVRVFISSTFRDMHAEREPSLHHHAGMQRADGTLLSNSPTSVISVRGILCQSRLHLL